MPGKLIDLVIIDPCLTGDEKGPLWLVDEDSWSSTDVIDMLRNLAGQNRKFASVCHVVVYTNQEEGSRFLVAFREAGVADIRLTHITRMGPDFKTHSTSIAISGILHQGAGQAGPSSKASISSSGLAAAITVFLPPIDAQKSAIGRPDISGCSMSPKQVGYRRRSVAEFRHFVRELSSVGNYVMCMQAGDASGMLAALLERRNAIGLDCITQKLGAAAWRLNMFAKTEQAILSRLEACTDADDETRVRTAVLVQEDIDAEFRDNPAEPSEEMMQKLETCLQTYREKKAADWPEDEFEACKEKVLESCISAGTVKGLMRTKKLDLALVGLRANLFPEQDESVST